MNDQTRRTFLKSLAGLGGAAVVAGRAAPLWASLDHAANPLGIPVGCQLYPVRDLVAQSFVGTLRTLREAGFQAIEMCSPPYYAERGFADLVKYSGAEIRKMINDEGLVCHSSHISITELRDGGIANRLEWASDLGLTQFNVPSLRGPTEPTMDDVKRAADEFNGFAAESARVGITAGIHNEAFESSTVDGQRTYDLLIGLTDPDLVKFQFQVSSISRGFDAAEYFMKYPGRFISMHVQGWDANARRTVPVGQGTLDWNRIFTAAKTGGVKNYFVEMNLDAMKASAPFLRNLQV